MSISFFNFSEIYIYIVNIIIRICGWWKRIKKENFLSTTKEENSFSSRTHAFPGKNVSGKRGWILKERSKDGKSGESRELPSSSLWPDMSFGTWVTYLFVLTGQPAANQEASIPLLLVTTRNSRSKISASWNNPENSSKNHLLIENTASRNK